MKRFKTFITEEKNLHMTHLEDAVIDGGVKGTRNAINYLRDLRNMLAGNSSSPVNLSTKWDGAPAVFAGTDPRDGEFFVAKKGVFNKEPKLYKTYEDIDADTAGKGDLNKKLKVALDEFSKLGIDGIIQGDFLYEKSDIKKATIDGESYITFHPNTIVYAIPAKSDLAKTILRSQVGVVWHTIYRGSDLESMSASFGEKIAVNLKEVSSVWSVDAVFEDVSGSATFTDTETKEFTKILSQVGSLFKSISAGALNDMGKKGDDIFNLRLNTYINSKVREGQRIGDPKQFVDGFEAYLNDWFSKEIDAKKSPKGKATWEAKRDTSLAYFKKHKRRDIERIFAMYNLIVDAKHIVVRKLEQVGGLKTFLKTVDGYEVTGQEGFVAIDHMGKNALKLVDRLQFSKANFSPDYIKGWQK